MVTIKITSQPGENAPNWLCLLNSQTFICEPSPPDLETASLAKAGCYLVKAADVVSILAEICPDTARWFESRFISALFHMGRSYVLFKKPDCREV